MAFVTGGASGLGRATALAFGDRGTRVMVADRDEPGARETVALIAQRGGTADCSVLDVGDRDQVQGAVTRTVELFGGLHCAFNNAGTGGAPRTVAEMVDSELDETWRVNVKGVWNCLCAQIPVMARAGGGAIVNTASSTALQAITGMSAYSVSKAAVVQLSLVAAAECAGQGIRVNALCPGPMRTPMLEHMPPDRLEQLARGVPVGRLGEAEEVAAAVLWLCSDEARYATGVVFPLDGGERLRVRD